jgi:Ca2+-transporting ATPase
MTLTFVSLVLIQFFKAYNYRSDRHSVLRRPFANRWLNYAVGWELVLLAAIVYVPFLQEAFGTFALTAREWALAGMAAFTVVPVLESIKWCQRHGYLGGVRDGDAADPADQERAIGRGATPPSRQRRS